MNLKLTSESRHPHSVTPLGPEVAVSAAQPTLPPAFGHWGGLYFLASGSQVFPHAFLGTRKWGHFLGQCAVHLLLMLQCLGDSRLEETPLGLDP